MRAAGHSEGTVDEGILVVRGLGKRYGALQAVADVDLVLEEGERRALIGPNGAGKSTLLKMIGGRLQPSEGTIRLRGEDITAMPEHQRVQRGLTMTFQRSDLFDDLTVEENVALAVRRHLGVSTRMFRPAAGCREVADDVEALLDRMELTSQAQHAASELSHGDRRHLEVAVALATHPRLLLLDEPVAGMSPSECHSFVDLVLAIEGVTVVVVEHNLDVVTRIATRITVLDSGAVIADGDPAEVADSPEVQRAYLGTEDVEELFT